MKEIQLTQGQVAIVDDEDFEYLNQWKWCARFNKHTKSFYAMSNNGNPQKTIYMHRVVMNTPKNLICDHVNHNTLNNTKKNLRNVTNSQSAKNRRGATVLNKSTGILGVYKNVNGFQAQISVDGKLKPLKLRKTLEEAIKDRKEAEIKYYGEYRGGSHG